MKNLASISLAALALVGVSGTAARAQCPWDGDEPAVFTHFVDADGDGACDRDEGGGLVVSAVEVAPGAIVHPNGLYGDCVIDAETGERQVPHGHWEYTHAQTDPRIPSDTEEKDYLTLPQALLADLGNQDTGGSATRASLDQTLRFTLNEPVRFDRFLRPSANPSGNYWQVDEWIGPAANGLPLPLLTWTERFFTCASYDDPFGSCGTEDGHPLLGGYWSTHRGGFDVPDCGNGVIANAERDPRCGLLFTTDLACPAE